MSITELATAIGEEAAKQGFVDAREGKAPAGADYFAAQTKRFLPVPFDGELRHVATKGLYENYMIGYEGGRPHD